MTLGLGEQDARGGPFARDNEWGRLGSVAVAARPVSIADYREFVVARHGYGRPEWWDPADYAHWRAMFVRRF